MCGARRHGDSGSSGGALRGLAGDGAAQAAARLLPALQRSRGVGAAGRSRSSGTFLASTVAGTPSIRRRGTPTGARPTSRSWCKRRRQGYERERGAWDQDHVGLLQGLRASGAQAWAAGRHVPATFPRPCCPTCSGSCGCAATTPPGRPSRCGRRSRPSSGARTQTRTWGGGGCASALRPWITSSCASTSTTPPGRPSSRVAAWSLWRCCTRTSWKITRGPCCGCWRA